MVSIRKELLRVPDYLDPKGERDRQTDRDRKREREREKRSTDAGIFKFDGLIKKGDA